MNTLASPLAVGSATADANAELCFHCGLIVPAQANFSTIFDGRTRSFCCVGCEAVFRTIADAGLTAYYRNRTGVAATPPDAEAARTQHEVDRLFELDAVRASYVATPSVNDCSADLYVDGITCAACVWLAESALRHIPGVTAATVNQITHRASVSWNGQATDLATLQAALRRVGLGVQPAAAADRFQSRLRARRRALIELGVALLSMMQVMMFTIPLYFTAAGEVDAETRALMGWAGLVLTLPVLLFSARPFFIGAWRDLAMRRIGMDLPIALAILATFATSTASLLSGGQDLYFDSISMFVFLLLAARYLESSARESSLQLIERLTNATPAIATRLSHYPGDATETVAAAALKSGDVIRVASGEAVAADGVIINGGSEFDESLLSGESRPVAHEAGAALMAGSLNLGSPVTMRVTRAGEATSAAALRRLTEQALSARPHFAVLADSVARWIAPLTLLLALAAALIWSWVDPSRAFGVTVAVLAITCPCALALAAPAAQALATTRLARAGLLVTRAGALERIAAATDIVFDKTGTLTVNAIDAGQVQLLAACDAKQVVAIAVALEAGSPHPLAQALTNSPLRCESNTAMPVVRDARFDNGSGVSGSVDGINFRLGRRDYVESLVGLPPPAAVRAGATLFLGTPGCWIAAIEADDKLKPSAADCVAALRASGLATHLVSGDRADRVAAVAETLAMEPARVRAAQLPAQKLAYANQLHAQGARWIAVGDGLNDAPMLGAADVSIAMGRGADLTRLTADAVLLSDSLAPLATARRVALAMRRVIRQNFIWAIAYNVIAIPFALAGYVSPAWAAIGMAVSSLVVVANALRLLRQS